MPKGNITKTGAFLPCSLQISYRRTVLGTTCCSLHWKEKMFVNTFNQLITWRLHIYLWFRTSKWYHPPLLLQSCTKPWLCLPQITYVLYVRWVNIVPVTLPCLLSRAGWGLRLSGWDEMTEFFFDLVDRTGSRTWCADRFGLNIQGSCRYEAFVWYGWNLDPWVKLTDRRCVNLCDMRGGCM